jgi:hypothetical protein
MTLASVLAWPCAEAVLSRRKALSRNNETPSQGFGGAPRPNRPAAAYTLRSTIVALGLAGP